MMFFHLEGVEDAGEKAKRTRELLETLEKEMEGSETLYGTIIRHLVQSIKGYPDFYILHEYLEENNRPLYFHQFVKKAEEHGLQYVCEERDLTFEGLISSDSWKAIDQYAKDRVRREQYVDFFLNGTFRRSMLCKQGIPLTRTPEDSALLRFKFSTAAKPKDAVPDFSEESVGKFLLKRGQTVTTNDPGVKAVLAELYRVWPRTMTFEQILKEVRERYPDFAAREGIEQILIDGLRRCQEARMVHMHLHEPHYVPFVSPLPVASPVARFQARFGETVTNLLHEAVQLHPLDREILRLLDGNITADGLTDIMVEDFKAGAVEVEDWPEDKNTPEEIRRQMANGIKESLKRLSSLALLVG
jgi:methyltransferase-like protein